VQVEYYRDGEVTAKELVELYGSVGWTAYTDDPMSLARAIAGSTFVVTARIDDTLVGLARVMSDEVSIFYLQDVLVRPGKQQMGIGRALIEHCLDRFSAVRQRVLLTDNEPHQHRLYEAAGFNDVASLKNVPLHAFVAIKGVELT